VLSLKYRDNEKLTRKVVPVQFVKACRGIEVYFHLFLTVVLDRCEWLPRPFYPRGRNRYPFNKRLAGPPESVWTFRRRENLPYRETKLNIGVVFKLGEHAVAQLVEALRYKSEGRGFDPDGVTGIFH